MTKNSPGPDWDQDADDGTETASSLRATLESLWREFQTAALFLTRLPLPDEWASVTNPSRASRAFPLLGAAIGIAGAIVVLVAGGLGLPPLATAFLAFAVVCAITGAMHETELAAAVEGLCAGPDRSDRLEAMHAQRPGVPGTLGVVFSVGLRVAALAAIADTVTAAGALIAAAAVSRGVLPYLHHRSPPVSDEDIAPQMSRPRREAAIIAALLGGLFVLLFLGPASGVLALVLAAGAAAGVAALADLHTGGMSRPASGAAQQAVETAILLMAAATL